MSMIYKDKHSGQDGRKAVTAFQRVSQHHKVLLGGYDGTQKIPVGRQGRIFKGKRACQYGTHYERQNADLVLIGSQQLYAAARGRRHSFDDERERHRHSEHGRKPERAVCHRAGRAVHAPQVRNAVFNADL